MNSLRVVGIVLIVLGVAGLAFGHIDFTTKEKVLDVGPIHATRDEGHRIAIPDIAAIAALIAGLGLIFASARRS